VKKIFKLSAMCLAVVVLATGCAMKTEYGIKVGSDKKVKIEVLSAMDDEMIDGMLGMGTSMSSDSTSSSETKTYTDAERWEYLESGKANEAGDFKDFEKTKYDKDGYKGYTYSLNLGDIENLVAESSDETALDSLGKDAKIFTKKGDVYSLNLKVSDDQSAEMEQYASMIQFDLKLKVTLPNKAKTNNATSVDGNTYTWDLTKAKTIELSFDFNGSKSNNIVLIAGAACAVIAIGIGVFVLTKKKQK
jgi:LPXTG-motif cell wall-anchored protein